MRVYLCGFQLVYLFYEILSHSTFQHLLDGWTNRKHIKINQKAEVNLVLVNSVGVSNFVCAPIRNVRGFALELNSQHNQRQS
mmetsp:Transcript_9358/g.28174  ORF Transcript_9358/g.28174 Transcript_9358/m.28174 type:complete len:82 (-) Transcript_9358:1224-1469(-)